MGTPVVLGLDFGGSKIAAAVAGADGTRIAGDSLPVRGGDDARTTFARGADLAHALAATIAPGRRIAAVGASTFGIPFDDRVELAPNVGGWESLAFGAELAAAFPGAVVTAVTDVKAAAACELRDGALAGCDPGLYLNLGTGLAVALAVGGRVVTGRNGAAGEIGYALRRPGAALSEPRLEEAVSGKALTATAERLLGSRDVAALLAGPDGPTAAARDEFVDELAFHLIGLTLALDPQRIVVGGGLVRAWQHVGPRLQDRLTAALPFPVDLVVAAYPFDAPLLGALALAAAALRTTVTSPMATAVDVLSEGAPT